MNVLGNSLSTRTDLTKRLATIRNTCDRLHAECNQESGEDLRGILKELSYQVSYLTAILHKHLETNER